MPTTTLFCLPSDVQAQMSIGNQWTGDDDAITVHIKTATALIRKFTRRSWEFGTFTQFFNTQDIDIAIGRGSNAAVFRLNEKPLQSIASVKYNTAGEWADTDPLPADNFHVDMDRNAVVIYPSVMSANGRSLQIVYTAGYPVNVDEPELLDVEEAVKQAAAIQAAFTFTRALNQTSGKSQKQDQKGFANFRVSPSGLVGEAQALLRGEARLLVGSYG